MSQSRFRQEMPPAGGYASLATKRIPARTYFSGAALFGLVGAMSAVGFAVAIKARGEMRRRNIELSDIEIAMQPFLVAERDRAYLKQLRKNFEAEKEIMKDVPGWEVGTYFGQRIYKTIPENYHMDPTPDEYFAHNSKWDTHKIWNYANYRYWTW